MTTPNQSIQDIYNAVLGSDEAEKVAADLAGDTDPNLDFEFNQEFFSAVESEEPEAVEKLAYFIDAARGQGMSDDEIENTIGELQVQAVKTASGEGEGEELDEFELKIASAYSDGAEKAVADFLESDFAKQAGINEDSIVDYEIGRAKGFGYAETMNELRAMGEKIAQVTAPTHGDIAHKIAELEAAGLDVSDLKKQAGIEPTSAVGMARLLMGKQAAEDEGWTEGEGEVPAEVQQAIETLQGYGFTFEG